MKLEKISFNHKNVVNLFIAYELDTWSRDLNMDFTLGDCLFGAFKLTENADLDKYGYSGYSTGFDTCSLVSLSGGDWGKNVVFVLDNSSLTHTDNRKKTPYFLVKV